MTTLSSQPSQAHVCVRACVCVCVANPIAYIFRKLQCSVLQQIHLPQIIILLETNIPVLQGIAFIHNVVFVSLYVDMLFVCTGIFRA